MRSGSALLVLLGSASAAAEPLPSPPASGEKAWTLAARAGLQHSDWRVGDEGPTGWSPALDLDAGKFVRPGLLLVLGTRWSVNTNDYGDPLDAMTTYDARAIELQVGPRIELAPARRVRFGAGIGYTFSWVRIDAFRFRDDRSVVELSFAVTLDTYNCLDIELAAHLSRGWFRDHEGDVMALGLMIGTRWRSR